MNFIRGEVGNLNSIKLLTVAALAERFMRVHVDVDVHCKPRTIDTYRGVLELHIMPALGGMVLSAVGRREIAALHHGLRDKPCTANAAVRVASSMFQRAEAWELVPPGWNPCRSVRRYKQHSRERFLTPEEYRCLGRALSEAEANRSVWPPAIAAIRLLMLTGCRHSEILTLRWDDVDRTAGGECQHVAAGVGVVSQVLKGANGKGMAQRMRSRSARHCRVAQSCLFRKLAEGLRRGPPARWPPGGEYEEVPVRCSLRAPRDEIALERAPGGRVQGNHPRLAEMVLSTFLQNLVSRMTRPSTVMSPGTKARALLIRMPVAAMRPNV